MDEIKTINVNNSRISKILIIRITYKYVEF